MKYSNKQVIQDNKLLVALAVGSAVIALGMLAIAISGVIQNVTQKMTQKAFIWSVVAIFLLMFMLQLLFLHFSPNLLRYDALMVFDEANSFFSDGGIQLDTKDGYFGRYTNNYAITVLSFLFLKVGRIMHIFGAQGHAALKFLQYINLFAIDVSLFIGFLLVYEITGKKSAGISYALFCIVCPLNYVWLPFYYTNTISMPFMMASIFLFYLVFLKEQKQVTQNARIVHMIEAVTLGFVLTIGFMIRATIVITGIACLIMLVLMTKEITKEQFAQMALVVIGVILAIGIWSVLDKHYIEEDTIGRAYPAVHWVMMGAREPGTFNKHDEAYTAGFDGKIEKKEADKNLLLQRLHKMGIIGSIMHGIRKMNLTFGDGTGDFESELEMSDKYGSIYRLVYGEQNLMLIIWTQAIYLVCFGGATFYIVCTLRKSEMDAMMLLALNLLGAFLFYMIWEAGNVYSIGFMPLFYVLNALSMEEISFVDGIKNKMVSGGLVVCSAFVIMLVVVYGLQKRVADCVYQVNQIMFQTDHYQECSDGIVLKQTFTSDGAFDHFAVQVCNSWGELNDSIYQISLENEDGTAIQSWEKLASEMVDYEFITFELDDKLLEGKYAIQIKKMFGSKDVIWLYYDTGNYDAYLGGSLTGMPVDSTMDLTFKVYLGKEKEDFFRKYQESLAQ